MSWQAAAMKTLCKRMSAYDICIEFSTEEYDSACTSQRITSNGAAWSPQHPQSHAEARK